MVTEAERQAAHLKKASALRYRLMDLQASQFSVRELWHITREPKLSDAVGTSAILQALWDRRDQPRYFTNEDPVRRLMLDKEGFWISIGQDGRAYPAHKHDAETVLHGLKPGVIIAIYAPSDSSAYSPEEQCPDP